MPYFGEPGQRVAYDVYEGPPNAPPLLLVHGFTASSASFFSNVPGLCKDFTVITVDLLGHGSSQAPADPALYAPGPTVERLTGLIDHLGYDRVLLCGHSLGGAIALRLALDLPDKVAGLVIINSSSAAGTPTWRESARPALAAMASWVREEGTEFLKDSPLYPAANTRIPADARELLVADFEGLTPEGVAGTAESLVVDINAWERVPDLAVPTLVVIGERDKDFAASSPAFLERLPARLTRWVTMVDAGHAANLESPAEFNVALTAFAEEIGYLEPSAAIVPAAASVPVALAAPPRRGFANVALTAVGSVLVAGGVALLAYALFFDAGGDTAASPEIPAGPTATPTTVDQVASERTPGPGGASTQPGDSTPEPAATVTPAESTQQASPEPTATEPATETAPETQPTQPTAPTPVPPDPTPALDDDEEATPEPTEEVETPTPDPPTPTPGPFVAVSGPGQAEVGIPVTFSASAHEVPQFGWRWDGCLQSLQGSTCTATFFQVGCFPVTAVGRFDDGERMSSQLVAVGGAVCE